jgi:DNA-binding CsgD family transcriptional regulator
MVREEVGAHRRAGRSIFGLSSYVKFARSRLYLSKIATESRTRQTSAPPRRSQPVDATLYLEGEMECGLMGHKFHRGFTAAEKTELWDRWKRGESLKAIGRAFGKQSSSIYFLVAPHGGIRPAQRRRSRVALTLAEREVISRGVTAHQSARSIARLLGRSPSTVSREMSRNGGCDRYRAALADENESNRSANSAKGQTMVDRDVKELYVGSIAILIFALVLVWLQQ